MRPKGTIFRSFREEKGTPWGKTDRGGGEAAKIREGGRG